jgi:hypothetical protein
LLAVVTTEWLLWKFDTSGLDDGTGSKSTGLDAHEQAVAAAEAKDVCETHDEDVLIDETKFHTTE